MVEAQPGLKWLSPAELEYRRIAAENPTAAQKVRDWLLTQKIFVKEGDQGFENQSGILQELRGRAVMPETIQNAIASIGAPVSRFHAARRPLHYIEAPRRTEPVSRAAKSDDGSKFLGNDLIKNADGSYRSKTVAEQRRDMEAKEAANQPSVASVRSRATAEAREKAESLQGSTHAETDQLKKLFVTSGTEIDWQATLASRLQMQAQFDKQRAVRRFIR